jgi:hypothetical protein
MEHAFGAWYVRGGIRELARAVYERCLARRVEFVFDAEVVSVTEKDGRAAGVELRDGTVAEADFVVGGPPRAAEALTEPRRCTRVTMPEPTPDSLACGSRRRLPRPARPARARRRTPHGRAHDGPGRRWTLFEIGRPATRPTVWVDRPDDPLLRPDDDHESVVVLTATVPSLAHHDWTADGARTPSPTAWSRPPSGRTGPARARAVARGPHPGGHGEGDRCRSAAPCPLPRWPVRTAHCCGPPTARAYPGCSRSAAGRTPAAGCRTRGCRGALVAGLDRGGAGLPGLQ